MSAIQTSATTPLTDTRPPARHRFWIPVSVLSLVVCGIALPYILEEIGQFPAHLQRIAMIATMGVPGGLGIMLLWWLFFSGFSWRMRITSVLFLGIAVGGFIFFLRKVELVLRGSYYVVPKFTFKWETTPEEKRAAYIASEKKDELPPIDLTVRPSDYARYEGRDGDGVAYRGPDGKLDGPTLALEWTAAAAPRVVYKRPCLHGYAGFAVAGNVAITLEQIDDKERVVCYDRATGRERWMSEPLGQWHDPNNMGDGPRTTPTIQDGMVYAIGATGILVCLDGTTGMERWRSDTMKDADAVPLRWGLSGSPLIVNNLVVVNPGIDPKKAAGRAVCAYNRETGSQVWATGDHMAGYSSPRLAKLCGVEQILLFDADGLAGLNPENGKEFWRFPWRTDMEMNIMQPLVHGDDQVFISSELSNGCAMVRIKKDKDAWSAEEEWKPKKYTFWAKLSNPVIYGETIFGLSAGDLYCIDAATGDLHWKEKGRRRFGTGQLLLAGDRVIVQSDKGEIFLVAAEAIAYKELGRFKVLDGKTWNTPALAGKQLFLRDNEAEMACVELPVR